MNCSKGLVKTRMNQDTLINAMKVQDTEAVMKQFDLDHSTDQLLLKAKTKRS